MFVLFGILYWGVLYGSINAAKNKLLSHFLTSIKGELEAQRSQLLLRQTDIMEMLEDHVRIYEAILNKDPVAAIQAMTNHLQHTYATILANQKAK